VKYNIFVTFYAWFVARSSLARSLPRWPFHIIFFLTSTGQTSEPISMVDSSNDAFPPKEVPFWVSLKEFDFTGSVTTKNRQKAGLVCDFPDKLAESINTHISVRSLFSCTDLQMNGRN
jgi:hypothetical protein